MVILFFLRTFLSCPEYFVYSWFHGFRICSSYFYIKKDKKHPAHFQTLETKDVNEFISKAIEKNIEIKVKTRNQEFTNPNKFDNIV